MQAAVDLVASSVTPGSTRDVVARIERIPFSSWHVRTRLIIGIATLFEGFNLLSISYVLPVLIPRWSLHPEQIGALIGVGFLGGGISTFAMGWLAERYGRRHVIVLSTAAFSVASLLCACAWNFTSMLVFRGLQGLAGGGEVAVAVTYITEISRAQGRGRFILLYEIIFPIGLVLAAIAGWWFVAHGAWEWMFIIGALPGPLFVFLQRALPESPRWLAARGRFAEAAAVVELIERATERATGQPLPPLRPIEVNEKQAPFWRDLFGATYRPRTLMIWGITLGCYLMNYGIAGWLPTVYRSNFHLSVDRALGLSLVTTAAGLGGTILCALLIDIVGRRTWFATAFGASAAALLWLWQGDTGSPEFVMTVASIAYFFISTISIGVFLYMPEIYPTRLRARAVCIATVWNTIAGIVGPSLIGLLLGNYGLQSVFLALATIGLVGALIAGLFAIETRGRVLEEISP